MAKQPNRSQAGMNIQQGRQQNAASAGAGQFGTEFASETDVQEVRRQNAASASGQYGAEFASETNAQKVRQQNQQAEANKAKNSGQFGGQGY